MQNNSNAPLVMNISVRPIQPQGNLYGFASVNIGGIKIDDFKIVQNNDGNLFVGMPSKPDQTSKTGYRNTVFVDKDIKEAFNGLIINKYFEVLAQEQEQAQARAVTQNPQQQAQPPYNTQQPPPQHYQTQQAQPRPVNQRPPQMPQQQPIAQQFRQAQNQANQHNAALPPPQQGNNRNFTGRG